MRALVDRYARGNSVEKIWLKHYPKGVPAEIDVNEYGSVRDVFEESVAKFAARPAFNCMGKTITFAELDRCRGRSARGCRPTAARRARASR